MKNIRIGMSGSLTGKENEMMTAHGLAIDRSRLYDDKRRKRIFALFVSIILVISASVVSMLVANKPLQASNPQDEIPLGTLYYNERDQISFKSETTIGASSGDVNSIAVGDIDNDGDLEVITVSYNDLTIWRSTADPWQLWDAYTVGDFALQTGTCVVVADLDNDGWLDIVAGDDDSNVWCWRNDHTPFESWGLPNRITSTAAMIPGVEITGLVAADFDHDGWTDVAVADNSIDGLNVVFLRNDQTPFSGLWVGLATGYVPASAVTSIDVADIDHNGWPDLVAGHASGVVVGWENNYDPFNTQMTQHLLCDVSGRGASINDVALGDIDNDGDVDVLTSDDAQEVYAWQNLGGAHSWDQMTGFSISGVLGFNATAILLGDLDNDCWKDVFAGTDDAGRVLTIANDHACWSDTWNATLLGYGGEGKVLSVGLGDLDRDGDLDSLSGHFDYSGGGGTCLSWQNVLMHRNMPFYSSGYELIGNAPNDGTVGDLDNDGDLDGVIARNLNTTTGEIVLIRNTHPGPPEYYYISVGASVKSVALADLDMDGDLEIIGGISGYLFVWYNIGSPWTGGWIRVTIENVPTIGYAHIRTGDLDLDGDIDIVVGCTGNPAPMIRCYQNDGTPFDGGWTMNGVDQTFPGVVVSLEVADFDKNGSLDIVAGGNSGTNKIVVYENDKSPFSGYWPRHDIGSMGVSSYPSGIVAADFDKDGDMDVAVSESYGSNRIYLLENDGTPYDGLWSTSIARTMLDDLWSLDAADFDLDGDVDLVVGGDVNDAYEVVVLINSGILPFSNIWDAQDVGAPNNRVLVVLAADLDNDCDSEIIALTVNARMYIYWNIGAQVSEYVADVSPGSINADDSAAILRIRVRPNGILSDLPAVVTRWCFEIYALDGITPLTPSEMNETFRSFSLYRDNGDLVWSNTTDSLVNSTTNLSGNVVIISVSASDPDAIVAQVSDAYFFFVVELQWGASIPGMRVYFDPNKWNSTWEGNLMEIQDLGKCLSVELTWATMTKEITVIMIPEFGTLLLPVIGMLAIVLAIRGARGRKETS